MNMHKKVSLFIPIYNEEKTIENNVIKLLNMLNKLNLDFELFIIDDGSKDRTGSIIKRLSGLYKDINYLRYENGPSRRENLSKSFEMSNGEIISFMDADLSTSLDNYPKLIKEIEDGADISTGCRNHKDSVVKREFSRKIISFLFNKFIKIYFGSKVLDHQCGFKAFKRDIILNLVNELGYDKHFKRKFFWDTELLLRAQKKNYSIKEIPIEYKETRKSGFNFFEELTMLLYIIKLKKVIGYVKNDKI